MAESKIFMAVACSSTNEQLLVGKVYEYIRGVKKPTVSWCSVIWNPTIPPKMSFILWLAKRNRLLALDKVAFLNKDSLYPLCSNEAESNAHLFFACRKSLQVWAHIRHFAHFRRRFTPLQRITNSLIRGRSTSGMQERVQRETLKRILEDNASAEYLQSLGLNGRTDPESFKACVPMVTHKELEPYIYRIIDGDASPILTGKPITTMSLSSGATQGKPKYVPWNDELYETTMQIYQTSFAFRNRDY
ncbi:Jasmonic acid-amido synthetase JAR1 [Glycine soja]